MQPALEPDSHLPASAWGEATPGLAGAFHGREKQLIDLVILDESAGQGQEEPMVADRVGMVVPGGDLELGRVDFVECVRKIEDGQPLVIAPGP